jgi:DNA adenine methylase
VLRRARAGDLVYFDPPYDPLSASARFTSYTAQAFDAEEQRRLAAAYAELARRGCHVILSNAHTPRIRGLYTRLVSDGLRGIELRRVEAGRAINSRADRRGPIPEYLIVHHA